MKKGLLSFIYFFMCIVSIQAQTLYGTTFGGGANGTGTIGKFIPATNSLIALKSFDSPSPAHPQFTNFIEASDGKLYGMTSGGGVTGKGTIFSYHPSDFVCTKLKDFDGINGANPYGSLVQASNGKIYGMTQNGGSSDKGIIFLFDPSNSTYTKLTDFDGTNGSNPSGSLIQANDGKLYGMTAQGGVYGQGVIFSFDPFTSVFVKVKDFRNTSFDGVISYDGMVPHGSLVQASDGKLYGLTSKGGELQFGTIFSFDPSSSTFTKLVDLGFHNGTPLGNLIEGNAGILYGVTNGGIRYKGAPEDYGVLFSFNISTSAYATLYDFNGLSGSHPSGSLTKAADGKLYGLTSSGGNSYVAGVIFSFDPMASVYTKLKDFEGPDGASPYGSMIQASNGKLYGMTIYGGGSDSQGDSYGVIFSFNTANSLYTKTNSFGFSESGITASAALLHAVDGKLYGMTNSGGNTGDGTIFSFDPATSQYTKLKYFDGNDGGHPYGSLIQGSNGRLYGMTYQGGSKNKGVIFSFDPATSTYTKIKDFDGSDGSHPYGSLMQSSNGRLYGMTYQGGISNNGVIFSLDPVTLIYTELKDFDGSDGSQPESSLIEASNGKLYGMTVGGGIGYTGFIFSFDPSNNNYTIIKDQGGYGNITQAGNGKLYGMVRGGIFSIDPLTNIFLNLKDFNDLDGVRPYGSLMQASDGKFYGSTHEGGSNNLGVVFSFDPATGTYTKLQDYNGANGASPYIGSAFIEYFDCNTSTMFYKDADGDGYGNSATSIKTCSAPAGYVTNSTDCNDNNAAVHPNAVEICGNGIDDNCDGQIDEGCRGKPLLSICDATVNESTGITTLTLTLSKKLAQAVTVNYRTQDGTAINKAKKQNPADYIAGKGTIIIPAGLQTATLSITIIADNIAEPTEQFYVDLSKASNATIKKSTATVTILDAAALRTSLATSNTQTGNEKQSQRGEFKISAAPNPSNGRFTIKIEGANAKDILNLRVTDVVGRVVETKGNVIAGQSVQIGNGYKTGIYFIQVMQGNTSRQLKVIKLAN